MSLARLEDPPRQGLRQRTPRYVMDVMHATHNPDGTFHYAGIQYALIEREDGTFDVRDLDHGSVVGELRIEPRSDSAPRAHVLPGTTHRAVLEAVADALNRPVGTIPLQ